MDWMIYGANGYTGELIAREAKNEALILFLPAETRRRSQSWPQT
jgi:short subunit dehydrogenase-like uncharacterized protein